MKVVLAHRWCWLVAGLFCSSAFAQGVEVSEPWVRATVAGQQVSGAFMTIQSERDATLVGAKSPLAGSVEIHEMKMDAGRMKMRAIPRLALPAGKAVELAPGGHHLMMFGLTKPLVAGSRVPLELIIETAGGKRRQLAVDALVKSPAGDGGGGHHHH